MFEQNHSINYSNSMASIQVISLDNDHHSSCLVVSTEKYRFLVDVGEGTQRLVVEHRVRLGKIRAVLLTSGQTSSVGGLPGMLLTLDDSGVASQEIICPPEAYQYMQATNYFMRSLGNFNMITSSNTDKFLDFEELSIAPILVSLQIAHRLENRLCFIGRTPIVAGKFDIKKAIELKIPKGPLYGRLKNGESVQLEDGRMIEASEIVGESTPAQYFAIICRIDEPSQISAIITENIWSSYYANAVNESDLRLSFIFHLSRSEIISHPLYQNWIHQFPLQTKHVFVGRRENPCSPSSFLGASSYNAKLHHLFGDYFINPFIPQQYSTDLSSFSSSSMKYAEPLMRYHLLPAKKRGLIESSYSSIHQQLQEDIQTFVTETQTNYPHYLPLQSKQQQIQAKTVVSQSETSADYEIFFLGTGCAIPSKYRNVSSFLIYLSQNHHRCGVLMDCGEGTWFQLLQISPPPPFPAATNNTTIAKEWARIIKLVWISHPHADHHLGLVQVILQRRALLSTEEFSPVVIIAPMLVYYYLNELQPLYPLLASSFVFIPNNYFDPSETCVPCQVMTSITTITTTTAGTPIPSIPQPQQIVSETIEMEEESAESLVDKKAAKRPRRTNLPDYQDYFEQYLSRSNPQHHTNHTNKSEESPIIAIERLEQTFQELGMASFINIPVIHCRQAYGVICSFTLPPSDSGNERQLKIVYSGDTRPCETLIYYGQDCDLLIHEATFEDEKALEAELKKHSTITEAMQVGVAMKCKSIVLTHFSQRYHGVPLQFHPKGVNPIELLEQQQQHQQQNDSVVERVLLPIIAFDLFRFTSRDIEWLPYLTYPIAELFAKEAIQSEKENELV